jgi:hypothetical protein
MVIAAGAAGLLALAGIWSSTNSGSADRARMYKAAESGLQMGKRWLRQNVLENGLTAYTAAETSISNGILTIEGVRVKVSLYLVGGVHFLVAHAEMSPCEERIEVTWRINNITGAAAPSTVTFGEWSESIQPCAF